MKRIFSIPNYNQDYSGFKPRMWRSKWRMVVSLTTEEYYSKIDNSVLFKLSTRRSFSDLMAKSDGIHPVEILASLKRLYDEQAITKSRFNKLIRSASQRGTVAPDNTPHYLPVPHQLDFDWRFSQQGILTLEKYILSAVSHPRDTIVFLGTPSLFTHFVSKYSDLCTCVLLDKNADLYKKSAKFENSAIYVTADISKFDPTLMRADIIVTDPPWYLEYYKMFLGVSALMCKHNAIIISAFPPLFTRPTIDSELEELTSYASKFGLSLALHQKNCLHYSTPPFEQNVLKVNGILCLPADWRTGDVVVFRRNIESSANRTDVPLLPTAHGWSEKQIGLVRVRYKKSLQLVATPSLKITLESIYDNDNIPFC